MERSLATLSPRSLLSPKSSIDKSRSPSPPSPRSSQEASPRTPSRVQFSPRSSRKSSVSPRSAKSSASSRSPLRRSPSRSPLSPSPSASPHPGHYARCCSQPAHLSHSNLETLGMVLEGMLRLPLYVASLSIY